MKSLMHTKAEHHTTSAPGGLPRRPGLLYLLLAMLAGGAGVAAWLARHKVLLETGLLDRSACNLGVRFDCDRVNTSEWSSFLGLPVALYAIPMYAVIGYLTWVALRAVRNPDPDRRHAGTRALEIASVLGLLALGGSIYLAYVSAVHLKTWCLFCMTLYMVNLAAAVIPLWVGPRSLKQAFAGPWEALRRCDPVAGTAVAAVLVAGVSWLAYDQMHATLNREALRRAQAPYEDTAPAASGIAATEHRPQRPARTRPQRGIGDAEHRPPREVAAVEVNGEQRADGWSMVRWPIQEDLEFWYGNPDASVTVVTVADFQCPHCRFVAHRMKPIKEEYRDRIRFAVINFPMDGKCNPPMANFDRHPYACEAARASYCAGLQGRFWEMHDALYDHQNRLDEALIHRLADDVGLDQDAFDTCIGAPETRAFISSEAQAVTRAGVQGTPMVYVEGRLVTSAANTAVLRYHLDRALLANDNRQERVAASTGRTAGWHEEAVPRLDEIDTQMIEARTAAGSFWIDPYEASITGDGQAVSIPGVRPASANWQQAKEACEKAGKRLCSQEEWVSACAGKPAVDQNGNGWFTDDPIQGNLYPYGPLFEGLSCNVHADRHQGGPVATGSMEGCRTPSGIYDLVGNVAEWVNLDRGQARLMGGHARDGQAAACNRAALVLRPDSRNHTTGFRCCADRNVRTEAARPASATHGLD